MFVYILYGNKDWTEIKIEIKIEIETELKYSWYVMSLYYIV